MKFSKMLAFILFIITCTMNAQEISDHAIGLRLGDSDGLGAQISYQKALGRYTRAEVDLGFQDSRRFNAFKMVGLFQWVHPIDGVFNWYYGFGAGGGTVNFEPIVGFKNFQNNFNFDVALGIRYQF